MRRDEHNDRTQEDQHTSVARRGSVKGQSVQGAPFTHIDIPPDAGDERNADRKPRAPQGPLRGPLAPTARETQPESNEPQP
jgi:hypothetical protein